MKISRLVRARLTWRRHRRHPVERSTGHATSATLPDSKGSSPSPASPIYPLSPCAFFDISPPTSPSKFKVVLEFNDFFAFHNRILRAVCHLLTPMRRHIGIVRDLEGKLGAELVERMQAFGARAFNITCDNVEVHFTTIVTLKSTFVDMPMSARRRYGFHISTFNYVDQLHLHCL